MSTVKRYWSAIPPVGYLSSLSPAARKAHDDFDAKLTKDDITEMQRIDADCNDCVHFQRGAMSKVGGLSCFSGHCRKFDKPTIAWPMQYSGHECFGHRRDLAQPPSHHESPPASPL
jgi:hypothetical protein